MQGKIRNRTTVALETAMHCEGKGYPQPPSEHKRSSGVAVYARTETDGGLLFLPANNLAVREFNQLSEDEKSALVTSVPPEIRDGEPECESRRILAGSRFKGLPRGKREGDVFIGDRVRPLYPLTTGSLAKIHDIPAKHPTKFTITAKNDGRDTLRALKLEYGLTEKQAEFVLAEALRRNS